MSVFDSGGYIGYNSTYRHIGTSLVTSGLTLNLDAGNASSYPGTGTAWTDLTGINSNGTLTNGTTYSSTNGGLFNFDGTDDWIAFPHNAVQNSASITFCSWVKPLGPLKANQNIVGKDGNSGYRYRFESDGTVRLFDRGATNAIATSAGLISANTWYNITVTGSPAGLQIFINGIFITSNATAFGGNASTAALAIGNDNATTNYGESFKGSIAQIQMYNRVLTNAEVLQNFNGTKSRYGL